MNIQQFNQILGKELDGDEIRNYQIHQLALNAIVNESVFENEFNELNFVFDEEIIAKANLKIDLDKKPVPLVTDIRKNKIT